MILNKYNLIVTCECVKKLCTIRPADEDEFKTFYEKADGREIRVLL
jgi:hypothetical protein